MADERYRSASQSASVAVLLSGGLDSTACLEFFQSQGFRVRGLHIDYGQAASKYEQRAASQVAAHYDVPLTICSWKGHRSHVSGEIVARNAFLIFAAAMELRFSEGLIVVGVHDGTPYFDCGEAFLSLMQQVLRGYTEGRIKVVAPFLNWTKADIWRFCISRRVPVGLTYSCEVGGDPPCGSCLSCLDRKALDALEDIDNSAQGIRCRA